MVLDLTEPIGAVARGVLLPCGAVVWTVFLARLVGLRSFSKMTPFDYVSTVATGSLIAQAATRTEWTAYLQSLAAITGVFLIQWLLATARNRSATARAMVQNRPVLLFEDGHFLEQAMRRTRVSRSNVVEKMRMANALDISEVRAVILETTGDMSVLHGARVDESVLENVDRV